MVIHAILRQFSNYCLYAISLRDFLSVLFFMLFPTRLHNHYHHCLSVIPTIIIIIIVDVLIIMIILTHIDTWFNIVRLPPTDTHHLQAACTFQSHFLQQKIKMFGTGTALRNSSKNKHVPCDASRLKYLAGTGQSFTLCAKAL